MNDNLNTGIWRKDYEAFYKSHLEQNKSVYDYDWCCEFIDKRINIPNDNSQPTLVDVGCGDGIWSIALSRHYNVTGIDNSKQGIENANKLNNVYGTNVDFKIEDILKTQRTFEYAFCRGPEFFGGYAPDSDTFQLFKGAVEKLFTKSLFFIVYSLPPFGRYASETKTSYYHDPDTLIKEFSSIGQCNATYENKYIVLEVVKNK